jgi:hypothetical protein
VTEFWETAFTKMQMAWGLEPTVSASLARDYFARTSSRWPVATRIVLRARVRGMDEADLKRELSRAKSGRRGRYSASLREAILEYAERGKEAGRSYRVVAAALGLSEQTLWHWQAARRREKLVRVELVPEPAPVGVEIVVEFGALRVRGLDIAAVADLLKRLG